MYKDEAMVIASDATGIEHLYCMQLRNINTGRTSNYRLLTLFAFGSVLFGFGTVALVVGSQRYDPGGNH